MLDMNMSSQGVNQYDSQAEVTAY